MPVCAYLGREPKAHNMRMTKRKKALRRSITNVSTHLSASRKKKGRATNGETTKRGELLFHGKMIFCRWQVEKITLKGATLQMHHNNKKNLGAQYRGGWEGEDRKRKQDSICCWLWKQIREHTGKGNSRLWI